MKTILVCYVLAALLLWVSCGENTPATTEKLPATSANNPAQDAAAKVKRGEYLATIMVCQDCHTPIKMTPEGPIRDPDRMFSGHPSDYVIASYDENILKDYVLFSSIFTAAVGPWGVSYAANLTPHETGLGLWTEEQFFRAIREGKHKGMANGRSILPPMPWEFFRHLTDEDLSALFAYLQSIKPVDNLVPPPVIAAPISMAETH